MYLKNRSVIVVLQMFRMIGGVVTWPGWQVVMDKKSGKHLEIMWHMMAINDSSTPVDF